MENNIKQLTRSAYPFLNEKERVEYFDKEKEAKELSNKRYQEAKTAVAKDFITQSRDLKAHYESKNEDILTQLRTYNKQAENEVVALDMFLYNNPAFRSALNALRPKDAQIGYADMALRNGDGEFARYVDEDNKYRVATLSTDTPGQGNSLQTTVSQSILYRVDNYEQVVRDVKKLSLPYGNYDATKYNKYALAGYITENNTVPDNTANLTDATNGINKVSYEGKEFGVSFLRSYLSEKRISASIINDQMNITSQEMGRGEAFQIISGTGAGLNDNGIINVATATTAGANVIETASNAIANCRTANAFKLKFYMNAKAWNEHEKLSLVNLSYQNTVNVDNMTLWGVPVEVVSDAVMPTTANVAKVIVGDMDHYLKFTNGGLDNFNLRDTSNAAMNSMFLMARDGGVLFADSFATYDVTVI